MMDDYRTGYIDGEASRDSEVAELRAICTEQIVKETEVIQRAVRAEQERDELREQVGELRVALAILSNAVANDDDAWITSYEYGLAQKALAATEQKT